MKMSDVKFNTRMTEGGPNIDETLTFVGEHSISAVDCAVHQHDQLTAINQELVEALDHVINKRVSNLTLQEYSDLIKRAKEPANEG